MTFDWSYIFSGLLGAGMTFGFILIKDWVKTKSDRKYVTQTECKDRRAECRVHIDQDFRRGSDLFAQQANDIKLIRQATMVNTLALIQLCEANGNDCEKLRDMAEGLTT